MYPRLDPESVARERRDVEEMTRPNKTLAEILSGIEVLSLDGDRDVVVTGVESDSRLVDSGSVFVALPGLTVDGHRFVDQAAQRGAVAVVVSRPVDGERPRALVRVGDTREALALLAANFFGHPSLAMGLVGITGTNGKTTQTYLLESILRASGNSPGVIGTVDARYAGLSEENPHTTPQAHQLQALLDRMARAGVDSVVMEVSSHALELKRVLGCHFRVAVFTNLSRDHLDFHGDLDSYARAKALLFARELIASRAPDKVAVVNRDDPRAGMMLQGWNGAVLRYGLGRAGDVHPAGEVVSDLDGIRARVAHPGGVVEVRSRLTGRHNLENLVSAVAVGLALGIDADSIAAGLRDCASVPGRLERVDVGVRGPTVFVDYAHTDHALANVLGALEPLTAGRLVVVFGCGGDRDQGKRPLMGAAVAGSADLAIVTSDNPRGEEPLAIIEQILPGLDGRRWRRCSPAEAQRGLKRGYCVVPDRREAIGLAVHLAREDDVVLIAGKGHESYQIVGDQRRDFDDREEARRALKSREAEP